jgi:hypothetical protein
MLEHGNQMLLLNLSFKRAVLVGERLAARCVKAVVPKI